MTNYKAVSVNMEIAVPQVPNFVRLLGAESGRSAISIAKLSDNQLSGIGAAWTAKLIERSAYLKTVAGK